jgi:hypothetical protein
MSARFTELREVKVTHYNNHIPSFVEPEIERLYGNLFSSFANFRAYGGMSDASVFVVSMGEEIKNLFLLRQEKNNIKVLNEGMLLDQANVDLLAHYIFNTFPGVCKISFHAVVPAFDRLSFPCNRSWCGEDIIIDLPETVDAYMARFGKATRKTIKNRLSRLYRSFPTFRFEVFEKDAVNEQHVLEVIKFNRVRMAQKNKVSAVDDIETQRILSLVRERGFVGIVTIDGRVCAGTVTYRIGENFFSRLNAHDPAYNDYKLGLLCCYLMICECIKQGAKRFHFLSGRYEYKYTLQGVLTALDQVAIYRSSAYLLRDGMSITRTNLKSLIVRVGVATDYKASCKDGAMSNAAALCLKAARSTKRGGKFVIAMIKNARAALSTLFPRTNT